MVVMSEVGVGIAAFGAVGPCLALNAGTARSDPNAVREHR